MSLENELNRWYKKTWETKGARFIAAKRYERIDRFSSLSIYIISAYLLCINLLVLLPDRPSILSDQNISFFTISASTIILIISIYISSRNYKDIANKFHSCGREINIIYDQICLMRVSEKTVIRDITNVSSEYNKILIKYDINHDKLDYSLFKCNNIKEYNIKYWYLYKPYIYLITFLNYYFIYLLAISCPLLILLLI